MHKPRHRNNPCSLHESEKTPAKIWELLRRNPLFRDHVQRLIELDVRAREETGNLHGTARVDSSQLMESLKKSHPFAAVALEWMVPEPVFSVRHVALAPNSDSTGKKSVSLVIVKLEEGTTPDPCDKQHWRTFDALAKIDAQSVANLAGRQARRGPHVNVDKSEDPRLCSKVDPIQECRNYFANGRTFTLATPWADAPPHFKREFCSLGRNLDSRAVNPIAGTRTDAPREHETHFFSGWSLMSCFGMGSCGQEDLARALMFDTLAKDYRVFAFPNSVRSRMEARRMANWLFEQLCRLPDGNELPTREPEIYGTPIEWDVFLFAGECNERSLYNAYKQTKPELKAADHKRKWRKEFQNYVEHFRAIERGIAQIFAVKT